MAKKALAMIEAEELPIGAQDHPFSIPSEGEARVEEHGVIEIVDGPRALKYKDKADALAFMEEPVVVHIRESADKNAENPIQVGVNGRMIVMWRGTDYIIKRKFLERLIRAQTTRVEQVSVEVNGIKGYRYDRKTAPTYPYVIRQDKNPLGRAWAEKVAAEA